MRAVIRKNSPYFYTNVDTVTNKMTELKINVEQVKPQIIAITECNPKVSKFEITKNIFHIDGYFPQTKKEEE